jgi:hypothetical protein
MCYDDFSFLLKNGVQGPGAGGSATVMHMAGRVPVGTPGRRIFVSRQPRPLAQVSKKNCYFFCRLKINDRTDVYVIFDILA